MKTKTIPFDLETAKKIQAGEIEGKIKTGPKEADVTIISFSRKSPFSIVGLISGYIVETYDTNGYSEDYANDVTPHRLCIELPEEEPKHEFKVGDIVKCENDDYQNIYKIIEFVKVKGETEIVIQDVELIHMRYLVKKESLVKQESLTKCENYEKYEFKPFDRVLVRDWDEQEWRCAIFSYEKDEWYYASPVYWHQCIPYEGNEHLVGTTNKPKEE